LEWERSNEAYPLCNYQGETIKRKEEERESPNPASRTKETTRADREKASGRGKYYHRSACQLTLNGYMENWGLITPTDGGGTSSAKRQTQPT